MSDYDNTNAGIFWRPHNDQKLAGQGKLNVNGQDMKIVIVKEPIKRDGAPEMVVYQKIGVLFTNDRKDNDKAPDFSGPMDGNMRLAAWKGEKDDRAFMSLKASVKQQSGAEATPGARRNLASLTAGVMAGDGFDDDISF
jgi:hypothetical protein